MNDTTTATVRTTVNGTVLTAVIALVVKITGWDITVEEVLPYTPLMVPIIAIFYRASRAIADKWPKIGVILFGPRATPTYTTNG